MSGSTVDAVTEQQHAFSLPEVEGVSMRTPLVTSLALGVAVACSTPTSVCGCSPALTVAVVFGRISTSGDTPLRGALIRVNRTVGACPRRGEALDGGFGETQSDSTGQYRIFVAAGADTVCVQAIAFRSASARTDSLVSSATTLALRVGPPLDSARSDFLFR